MSTLQNKRITDNWDSNKTYRPAPGEIVEIALDGPQGVHSDSGNFLYETGMSQYDLGTKFRPIIVIGTATNATIDNLVGSGSFYLSAGCCVGIADYVIGKRVPNDSNLPGDITNTRTGIKGTTTDRFALSDHSHYLGKTKIYNILEIPYSGMSDTEPRAQIGDLACRRITMSERVPSKTSEFCQIGDIHIKLSPNPME